MRTAIAVLVLVLAAGGEPQQVTQSGRRAFEPSLTPLDNGFVVAWHDTRDGHSEIYARPLDARGQPAGPERRLTNGTIAATDPDVAAVGNNLAVGWHEAGATLTSRAMLGMWARDGRRLWTRPLAAPERISRSPTVRVRRQRIFCAWVAENAARDFEVYAAWFDNKGNPITPAVRVGPASPTTGAVNATLDANGDAWVVYHARVDTQASELFVARVSRSASHVARVTSDDGSASQSPDVAVGGDRVALTWHDRRGGRQDVLLFIGRADDITAGFESRAVRVTNTSGESIGAHVAWSARRRQFAVSWSDTGTRHEVHVQTFDPDGSAGAAEHLARRTSDPLIPAIRSMPSSNGFALAWADDAEVSIALIR